MRKFGLMKDAKGYLRFALNDQPLFLYGPLDQGYFPDGLYTPPSEEAMLFDIEYTKRIGCNMIRKHIKVESLRWYYACDRLGMIVWQDMPNGGLIDGEVVATLSLIFGFHRNDTRRLNRFGRDDSENRARYRSELQGMLDHLHNSACIAVWVPFNESWGQFQSGDVAKWVKEYDPTRLVEHASGWFDQGAGDFQSKHIYFKKLKRPKQDHRAFVVSEFGGYSLKAAGHLWNENKKFGYRFYKTSETLTDAYLSLLEKELKPLILQGLAAAVYTQTTDVEIEINGYLTYDRKVEKMNAEKIRRAHVELYELFR
jgi:beta-galactosidase/beta-glucuronidase